MPRDTIREPQVRNVGKRPGIPSVTVLTPNRLEEMPFAAFSSAEYSCRVGGARKSRLFGALREPVQNSVNRYQGFGSATMSTWCPNPPFFQRFAPRTLQSLARSIHVGITRSS